MASREVLIIEAGGERFRFYFDQNHPLVLHIALRHGTSPDDAIRTFFSGAPTVINETYSRFETLTDMHGIYWTRHAFDQSVIIISCFRRGGE